MENSVLNNKTEKEKKKDFFIPITILICICSILFNMFFYQLAFVNGNSMFPTMKDGQLLIIDKISSTETYKRGDIIIFDVDGKKLIKRLVALPGETVQIKNNDIYINDNKIEDYVDIDMEDIGCLENTITLNKDEYVFLGDNRNNSSDSRKYGPIKKEKIIGKIIFRFFPLDTKF